MTITQQIAAELQLQQWQVDNAVELLDGGNTVPFVARYRKEKTGSLDDTVLRNMEERLNYLRKLDARKEEIIAAIDGQGKLTEELATKIRNVTTLVEAEDLYLPYRPKRKTRASVAIAKGLEPLAKLILQQNNAVNPEAIAESYLNAEVPDVKSALQGAMDILAEEMASDAGARKELRRITSTFGTITSKAKEEDADTTYKDYFDFQEPAKKIPGHRILALDRGEKQGVLRVSVDLPQQVGQRVLNGFVKGNNESSQLVKTAAEDAYGRLLYPAVERDIRKQQTEAADKEAIAYFKSNLRQLLMGAPLKNHVVLGVDPGYRTGCKLAVVDATGKVLETGVAHITLNEGPAMEAGKALIRDMMIRHHVTAVSIGNGTASRESERVVAEILRTLPHKAAYMVVSEAGASVYSASPLGAEEFPDFDATQRSAVSIARRLQDPLAELVKIEPQAIGIGQYQHDMPQAELKSTLDGVVEDCVNSVGVDLNTASYPLLSHIAGINGTVAKNIVAYRTENGAFTDRKQLKKVSKLGPKAYEQCAGFLRVSGGVNPLDNTGVHPESYGAAKAILEMSGAKPGASDTAEKLQSLVEHTGYRAIAEAAGIGEPTAKDIIKELSKPGRDPRDELPPPLLRSSDVMELKDLQPGMELTGTVRNIVAFGCFVDVGVHEDGLVHISQLADKYISNPMEVVKVGQVVKVWVLDVDLKRNRLSLTMKQKNSAK